MPVKILSVAPKSPCAQKRIKAGDILISINGNPVDDILDYRFYIDEVNPVIEVERGGTRQSIKLKKRDCQETGLEFETFLMDKQRRCKNNCIFCFIDQLPKGLRESLYFKDDDSRLSFLFGNYITLTNLTEREVSRIIKMRISPVNISVHTMNPGLRCDIMRNPKAGDSLRYIECFAQAGIKINTQLVLCPGINDGSELEFSLEELGKMFPSVQSIAAVPVGLTSHREGLFNIEPYDVEKARKVIKTIECFNNRFIRQNKTIIAYPADEFFITADVPFPQTDYYGDFAQLENGVGLWALLKDEFYDALNSVSNVTYFFAGQRQVSIATGEAAYPLIKELVDETLKKWHNLKVKIFIIKNIFFGSKITVAGLLTGRDMKEQLAPQELGDELLIPAASLRYEGDMFLDGMTVDDLSKHLGKKITAVNNNGRELLEAVLGKQAK